MGIYLISTISRIQRTTFAHDSSTRLATRIETHNQCADGARILRDWCRLCADGAQVVQIALTTRARR